MDPVQITTQGWKDTGMTIIFLWLLLLFVIAFASNMLLAQGLIPSLTATRHLPRGLERLRRFFYLGASLALIGIGVVVWRIVLQVQVIGDFYARWWI
ncbi:MAG: hypothetical protein HYU29_04945 [Chloroflexi bacterium]|nr:hypothetical protein [Chloroflexota bacterium]